jgi:CxxC motif-containing protein (DUF1111 family)
MVRSDVWGRAAQVVRGLRKKREPVCCMGCHTPMMVTPAQSETEALQNLTVHPFSDLLIHHMGKGLADDITQGKATGDMFRTTPLWGLGQRIFFLHDGRTFAHFSPQAPSKIALLCRLVHR